MAAIPEQEQLSQAFSRVIDTLKGPLALGNQRLAVIGGFCVQHYLGSKNRKTKDLDLMIELACPTTYIKKELVKADPDHFQLRAGILYYYSSTTDLVQVDLISHEIALPYYHRILATPLCEGLPAEAIRIADIQADHPPFLSVKDMIALKFYCCGTRATREKNTLDAEDASALVARLPKGFTWEQWQRAAIQAGQDDVSRFRKKRGE